MASTPSDSDTLLAFSAEAGAVPSAPIDRTGAPEAPAVVAHTPPLPAARDLSPAIDTLTSRVARLERAVEDARSVCAQLRSEVETLVRARAENPKPPSRQPIVAARPLLKKPAQASWTASAIAAVSIGVIVALAGWRYWPGHAAASIIESVAPQAPGAASEVDPAGAEPLPPEPATTSQESSDGAPAPVAPVALVAPAARVAPAAHVALASVRAESDEPRRGPQTTRYAGTLSIDAEPGGNVFIDRRPAGKTPLRVENLRAGSHLVWIEREGFRRWTRVVSVPADRVSRVSAGLEPLPAR